MPQIPQFVSPVNKINPSETGVDAAAQAARRLSQLGEQIYQSYHEGAQALQQGGAAEQRGGEAIARAGEGFAHVGERIGQSIAIGGKTIDDVGQWADDVAFNREISHGSVAYAGKFADWTDQWNKIIADPNVDPNDTQLAKKFIGGTVMPQLQQLQQGFVTERGRQWAMSHAANFVEHFYEKTNADMGKLAGQAVSTNIAGIQNAYVNTVFKDPSSVKFAMDQFEHSLRSIVASANLNAEDSARVSQELLFKGKQQIVQAAGLGAISKNPDAGLKMLNDPELTPYVNVAELKTFQGQAQLQTKQLQNANFEAQRQQRLASEDKVRADANTVFKNNVTFDQQTGRIIVNPKFHTDAVNIVMQNPNAPNAQEAARTLIDWGENQQKRSEQQTGNTAAYTQLTNDMFGGSKPLGDILIDAAKSHSQPNGISDNQFKTIKENLDVLEKQPLNDPVFKNAMKGAQQILEGPMKMDAMLNPGKYPMFAQAFLPQYLQLKREGKLPPNALDLGDPNSLITKFVQTAKNAKPASLSDMISANGGVGAPVAPKAPDVGAVVRGYTFRGGDPSKQENWERVAPECQAGAITLPPLDERKAGSLYPTPRPGNMKNERTPVG